jgi:menaquinol-cytochrome c reductase iron-sulfur subunit
MSEQKMTVAVADQDRRGFFKRICAAVIGAVLGLLPLGAGLNFMFDPVRRKGLPGATVRVATLDALPEDGIPRRFQVLANKVDAWNRFSNIPVGAIYLRRVKDRPIEAFNASCPHAGCSVGFEADRGVYSCPCHKSTFNIAGAILDKSSPASRGLDSLEVELRGGREIWVRFQNFQAGRPQKVPLA